MRSLRFHRAFAAAGALVAVVVAGSLLPVLPASASAKAKTVTCTSLSGNLNSPLPATFTLGGCSGNTGGSGSAQGSTITWENGRQTYLTTSAFTPLGKQHQGNCGDLSDKWTVSNRVAGDSTGSIKVLGKVSAKVCILNEGSDPWSLAPGSVFTLH